MKKSGWLKWWRSALDNPVVMKTPEHLAIWVVLLSKAAVKPYKAVFKGKRITVRPGQLITGRDEIAKVLNNKTTSSKVQRVLKEFENEHQIEQQTSNKNRLITLTNWCQYQQNRHQNEQQVNNKRTTSEQQNDTNKEDKEYIENKKNEREGTLSRFGQFKNVLLTDLEMESLRSLYPDVYEKKIERLSRYIESKGKDYDNHYAVLCDWIERDYEKDKPKPKSKTSYDMSEVKKIDTLDFIE